jgi:hypothetical protein
VAAALLSQAAPLRAETDLDAFMRQVLEHRDDNWKKLQQYILDEREQIELRGPSLQPIWGERREYTWYILNGLFVRSPVKFNGVEIGDAERRKYEAEFLKRAEERERRALQPGLPASGSRLRRQCRASTGCSGDARPQFVSSATSPVQVREGTYARRARDARWLRRCAWNTINQPLSDRRAGCGARPQPARSQDAEVNG